MYQFSAYLNFVLCRFILVYVISAFWFDPSPSAAEKSNVPLQNQILYDIWHFTGRFTYRKILADDNDVNNNNNNNNNNDICEARIFS